MKIEYENKVNLNTSPLPRRNKVIDADMNEIKNVVNANAGELLWENSSPTSDFAGQSIPFGETNNYEWYRIVFKPTSASDYTLTQDIMLKGGDTLTQGRLLSITPYTPGGDTKGHLSIQIRNIVANNGSIAFTDCLHYFSNSDTKEDPANSYMIPVKIYGYSFG